MQTYLFSFPHFLLLRYNNGGIFENAFQLMQWDSIDIFCYFSHYFITIPTIPWINVCRHNGVAVMGTFITEWEMGIITSF